MEFSYYMDKLGVNTLGREQLNIIENMKAFDKKYFWCFLLIYLLGLAFNLDIIFIINGITYALYLIFKRRYILGLLKKSLLNQ